jgi:hypothetical protein
MPISFQVSELPNPFHLTAPENLEYIRLKKEAAAKSAKKAPTTAVAAASRGVRRCAWLCRAFGLC